MKLEISSYDSYKSYLIDWLNSQPKKRGLKLKLAAAMTSPPSHLSQVMRGTSHLTLEQAEAANRFFGHNREESHGFLLLVQMERAGTPTLRRYFRAQLEDFRKSRLILKNRISEESKLSLEDQTLFFSQWYYSAILVSISLVHASARFWIF